MDFRVKFWNVYTNNKHVLKAYSCLSFSKRKNYFNNLKYWEELEILRGMMERFLCHLPYCPARWCY